jgi:uncharacterized damage-inducible protein DinB
MQPIIPLLQKEFESETATLRRFLEKVPSDKFDWKPHGKNMTMKQLTVHLAEIPGWIMMALTTEGLDFAGGYKPTEAENTNELVKIFDENYAKSKEALGKASEDDLNGTWTMRMGEQVLMSLSKYETIRHAFAQMIHHRAQLGIYFRLLDMPVPKTYGPSADDTGF